MKTTMVKKSLLRLKTNITHGLLEMSGRKKLATFATIVVTAVWAAALYLHIQAYTRYVQKLIEMEEALGFPPGFTDPHAVPLWGFGPHLVISGIFIIVAWIFLLPSLLGERHG